MCAAEYLSKKKPLRLVAYGADPERGNGSTDLVAKGYRQTRTTTSAGVTRRHLKLKAGTCIGDSGSPVFLGNTKVVASLITFVPDEPCDGPFLSQRLDTRSEQRFLSQFVRLR